MSFRRIFPASERQLLDGGLNSKFHRSVIAPNESPDCLNVMFGDGTVFTREGASKLNTQAIASAKVDGLYVRQDKGGNETMVAFCNGSAWYLSGTTFVTIPSAQSQYTAGVRATCENYENYLFAGNGATIPMKYNGTEWTRHGVYAPTTTSTVASQSAGVLTGDYRYKVTGVNSAAVESDVGPVTATFAATSAMLRVTSIPTYAASFGVNKRRLFRTATSGSTFMLVTTLADNTTTTYDDNNADSTLTTVAPTDQGVPPNYSVVLVHADRLFMLDPANENYCWYSELGNPYVVKTTSFLRVGDKAADVLKAIGAVGSSLYLYGERSEYMIYMPDTTPSNWLTVRIQGNYGCKSPFGVANYAARQFFPAMDGDRFAGFGAVSGSEVEPDATFLTVATLVGELKSSRIETDMFSIKESLIDEISAIVYRNRLYVTVPYGGSATENNRIYVIDRNVVGGKQDFSFVPWTGLNARQFAVYSNNLYYGSSLADGFVYKLFSGVYSDAGTAINSYWWTKEYGGDARDYNLWKDFRYLNLFLETTGDWFMDVFHRLSLIHI